jgi:hypothetical protein
MESCGLAQAMDAVSTIPSANSLTVLKLRLTLTVVSCWEFAGVGEKELSRLRAKNLINGHSIDNDETELLGFSTPLTLPE